MSPARIIVRAVVAADGRSPHLAATLDAVLGQDPAPDYVHLALTADVEPPTAGWDARVEVTRVDARDLGQAVDAVLAAHAGDGSELLWIVHDDMAPLPGALAALAAIARKRRLAGLVGAAQVRWDAPDRLVGLGTTTTRVGARRIDLVEQDDVDQGQYAERDDVLAVSLGGALVRRELWELLEGTDGAAEGWASSLDFSRRAWRAGYDVVAVPAARIRHSQERLYGRRGGAGGGRRATYGARRAAEWYHAQVYAWWWAVPLLGIWAIASALARAVLRIAQNEPRLLIADLLVPWRLLLLAPRVPRARAAVRRAGRSTAAERRLLAGLRQIARHVRALEFGERSSARVAQAPSEVMRRELAALGRRRRLVLTALAIALTAFSIALHPSWAPALLRGDMLAGTALGVTDLPVGDLWDRALTGWSDQAFGAPAVDGGLATLLLPLALIPGGLALWLGVLLLVAPVLAGLTAWAAAGAFSRSLWLRALAAGAYALWPLLLTSVAQGRVAAVIVHIVAPLAVLALVRAGGWHRGELLGDGTEHPPTRRASRSAAAGAGAALAVMVMAAPALVLLALPLLIVVGAFARGARWRLWIAAVAPLVAAGAGLVAAARAGLTTADAWSIVAREPGPSAVADPLSAAELLLGAIGETGAVPTPLVIALRTLPVAALGAAAIGAALGARRLAVVASAATAAGALALAVHVQALTLSPDQGADGSSGSGWPGPFMSVVAVALLAMAAAGWGPGTKAEAGAQERAARGRALANARRLGAALVVVVVAGACAGAAAAQAWPGREALGDVAAHSRDVLPLVASLEQRSTEHQRVLVLDETPTGVVYEVLAGDGADALSTAGTLLADGSAAARAPGGHPVAGPGALGEAVAALVAGGGQGASALADWGIGVVVAAPSATGVADVLAQSTDLRLMGAADRGSSWRVGAAEGADRVSRATFTDASGAVVPVPLGRSAGTWEAPAEGTLVMAVPADDAWSATLDGRTLGGTADDQGRQMFSVPGGGTLAVAYDDRPYRVWFWATVVTVVWALVAAIPVRSRRSRQEVRS